MSRRPTKSQHARKRTTRKRRNHTPRATHKGTPRSIRKHALNPSKLRTCRSYRRGGFFSASKSLQAACTLFKYFANQPGKRKCYFKANKPSLRWFEVYQRSSEDNLLFYFQPETTEDITTVANGTFRGTVPTLKGYRELQHVTDVEVKSSLFSGNTYIISFSKLNDKTGIIDNLDLKLKPVDTPENKPQFKTFLNEYLHRFLPEDVDIDTLLQ